MSQRDEKDLLQNEKTGQAYFAEGGREEEKRKWAMPREGEGGGGRMMCRARADKAEPGAAGEPGVCQPSSQ